MLYIIPLVTTYIFYFFSKAVLFHDPFVIVCFREKDVQLEVLFFKAHASLGALGPPVSSSAQTRQAAWPTPAVMELRKSHLQLSLLQRPYQLGHGA